MKMKMFSSIKHTFTQFSFNTLTIIVNNSVVCGMPEGIKHRDRLGIT